MTDLEKVRQVIIHYIYMIDTKPLLNPLVHEHMANNLTLWIRDSVNKFLEGQIKHGGDIRDRDLEKEYRQEMIDMFWYLNASKWNDARLDALEKTVFNPPPKTIG